MPRERLVVFGLCLAACKSAPEPAPGAALVDIVTEVPPGYRSLGPVACQINAAKGSDAESLERCKAMLRSDASDRDADIVVIDPGAPPCIGCVALHGVAYRRELPFEHARSSGEGLGVGRASTPATLSSGTGFVVGTDGTILTANHVVRGARTISVTAANGTRASANVARRLESFDLALLKASVPLADYAPLGDSKSVEVGQRVWTLGFPVVDFLGIEPKFSDGSVSSLSGIEDAPQVFQVTVPVQPGNSGGPLVTEDGFVVGVVVSRAAELPFFRATGALPQGVNFAVKVDPARGLFVKPADLPKAASRSAAVARIKSAICFIESVTGDGLLSAPAGFGDGFVPARSSAEIFERNRKKCAAADPEGCLAAAKTLLSECAPSGVVTSGGCRHARFARTILDHACAVGRHDACTVH